MELVQDEEVCAIGSNLAGGILINLVHPKIAHKTREEVKRNDIHAMFCAIEVGR